MSKPMSTFVRLALPFLAAAGLAACSEQPQVVKYEAGKYQGKTDTRPWESAGYKGDKARWESDLRARAGYQNELRRVAD